MIINIPLLKPDTGCPRYLYERKAIENPEPLKFKIGRPVPKKIKMADFHPSPYSVISKNIFDVLSPLKIEGIQLLPSIITSEDEDQVFNDYWAIHTYHRIRCIDVEKSDCEIKNIRIANVKKIVLDKKVLGKIPLTKRLIFRLEEDSAYELYHITVMESIMNVNPEGVEFTNIEEWNNDSYFQ